MSPVPYLNAYAIDYMSFHWDQMFAYAFRLSRFMSAVLQMISAEQGLIIIIVLAWPKKSWFPDRFHMSLARSLVIPKQHNILSSSMTRIFIKKSYCSHGFSNE